MKNISLLFKNLNLFTVIIYLSISAIAISWFCFGLSVYNHNGILLTKDIYKVHTPVTPYWIDWGWDKIDITKFSFSGLPRDYSSPLLALYFALLTFISSALSNKTANKYKSKLNVFEKAILPFTGFVFIYLSMSAINRLLSLFLTTKTASIISLCFIIFIYVISLIKKDRDFKQSKLITAIQFGIILFSAVLLIQFGFAFITGDRTISEIHNIMLSSIYSPDNIKYLPVFAYHYDELSFLLPIYYTFKEPPQPNTILVGVWLMQLMVKVSAFSVTYFSIRSFGVSRTYSTLLVALVFFGALSFDPTQRIQLFDSSNPIYFTLHPGRVISSLSAFWVIALMRWIKINKAFRFNNLNATLVIVLTALGLTTTTFNVTLIIISIISVWVILEFFNNSAAERLSCYFTVGIAFVAIPVIYWNFKTYTGCGVLFLTLLSLIPLLYVFCAIRSRGNVTINEVEKYHKLLVIFVACSIAGFSFGNLGVSLISNIFPGIYSHGVISPQAEMMTYGSGLINGGNFAGDFWPIGHQYDIANFSARYGMPIVLTVLTLIIIKNTAHNNIEIRVLLISILVFIFGLFIMDYVKINNNYSSLSWDYSRQFAVRTRLVEAGFYAAIISSLSIIGSNIKNKKYHLITFVIAAYVLLPNINNDYNILNQFWVNLQYISTLL